MLTNNVISDVIFGHNEAKKDKGLLNYFLDTGVLDEVFDNEKYYIFGRKGSGKSAICHYILKNERFDRFSTMLSFYDFPMEKLYKFSDRDYQTPSQYKTLWKYLLYIEFAKLILKDTSIPECDNLKNIKKIIEMNFESSDISYNELLNKTSDIGFKLALPEELLGVGFEFYKKKSSEGIAKVPYNKVVSLLEKYIKNITFSDDNTFVVMFDELDKKYDLSKEYQDLIISLFDVINDVNFSFGIDNLKCIVFLRTDIFNKLKETDLNKISDDKVTIDWLVNHSPESSSLREIINLRIRKSISELEDHQDPWIMCFGQSEQEANEMFEYILDRTYHRPRDLIQFCKECQREAKKDRFVNRKSLNNAEFNYSRWLKKELIDEMHVELPEIDYVFDAIREIGTQVFSFKKFSEVISQYPELNNYSAHDILKVLFQFSVIGDYNSRYRQKRIFFIYRSEDEDIKFKCTEDDEFLVFRGLNKALKLVPVR